MNTNNHHQIWTTDEQRKLIAAAPSLLNALSTLVHAAHELNTLVWEDRSRLQAWRDEAQKLDEAIQAADEALSKAQG